MKLIIFAHRLIDTAGPKITPSALPLLCRPLYYKMYSKSLFGIGSLNCKHLLCAQWRYQGGIIIHLFLSFLQVALIGVPNCTKNIALMVVSSPGTASSKPCLWPKPDIECHLTSLGQININKSMKKKYSKHDENYKYYDLFLF